MHILVHITPRGVNHSTVHGFVGEEDKTGKFYQRIKPLLNELDKEIQAMQMDNLEDNADMENLK